MNIKNLLTRLWGSGRSAEGAGTPAALLQDGLRRQANGDEAAALASFRQVLAVDTGNADAHYLLGATLGQRGQLDAARTHLRQALASRPAFADAHLALGNVCLLEGDADGAASTYAEALRLMPDNAAVWSNLGLARQTVQDHAGALAAFARAFELAPAMRDAVRNLTIERLHLDRFAESESHLRELLAMRPDDYEVLLSLGFTLQKQHRPQQALECYERARAIESGDPELLNNLGIVLQDLGRLDEALACYDAAIARKPGFELARWHRTLALLLRHDFSRGWQDYDLRLGSKDRPPRPSIARAWRGEDPANLQLLIYGEQGIGDEIMFASCLPQMIGASRHCVVECSERLLPLFRRSFPAADVRVAGATTPAPAVDAEVAMGSLPQYLRRDAAAFPRHDGYLAADPARVEAWRARFAALGPGPVVGISWQGGTHKTRSPARSLPLAQWAPLLKTGGMHFVDLQYTDCAEEVAAAETALGMRIHRWRAVREDFEDTAAIVAALDLVVSVCTAVIHLGGALGRPVWVLAPYSPEWRYGIQGESMPWYPSVRVFRQRAYGAWDPLLGDVAQSLTDWCRRWPYTA